MQYNKSKSVKMHIQINVLMLSWLNHICNKRITISTKYKRQKTRGD